MGHADVSGDPLRWSVAARNERSVAIDLRQTEGGSSSATSPRTPTSSSRTSARGRFQERGSLTTVADERHGELTVRSVVPRPSDTPGEIAWAGRALGADTDAVLTGLLGRTAEEVARRRAAGVVGARRPTPSNAADRSGECRWSVRRSCH